MPPHHSAGLEKNHSKHIHIMGSGASTELQREFYLTSASPESESSTKLEAVREEISRLRRKLHNQAETFGEVSLALNVEGIKERETQKWSSCHAITESKEANGKPRKTKRTTSLFGEGGPSPNDVVQSAHLGDCYLVAAMSVVAEKPELVRRMFPDCTDSSGILPLGKEVKVLINHQKQWREIIVDTSFPIEQTSNTEAAVASSEGAGGGEKEGVREELKLLYGKSSRPGTYWVSFLEKAYAKVYGSYAAIQGGDIAEALSDLTGFPVVTIKVGNKSPSNWDTMLGHHSAGQLMACGFICSDEEAAIRRKQGVSSVVRSNHAYSMLNVQQVVVHKTKSKRREVVVVRLRNPWGHLEADMHAASFDLPKDVKDALAQHQMGGGGGDRKIAGADADKDDGTFWLEWSQFAKSVNHVYVCLSAGADSASRLDRVESVGRWTAQAAGGCSTYPTFRRNPMYKIDVPSDDGRITLTLTQPDVRLKRRQEKNNDVAAVFVLGDTERHGAKKKRVERAKDTVFSQLSYNQIGLEVISLRNNETPHVVLGSYDTVIKSSYWNKRDVTLGPFNVSKDDTLVVVPSTYYPGQISSFLLSAYFQPSASAINGAPRYLSMTDIPKPLKVTSGENLQMASAGSVSNESWYTTSIKGAWSKEQRTSGGHGSPSNSHFGQNPQWQICFEKNQVFPAVKMVVFLKNESVSTNDPLVPLEKKRRVGMGLCLYRGVHCIRSTQEYIELTSDQVIGKVTYSNALEIARSETLHRGAALNFENLVEKEEEEEEEDKESGQSKVTKEGGDEPILLVAACYKEGDEAPFTVEIVSNAPLSLKDAPTSRPTLDPTHEIMGGGKKFKKKKGSKKKGSKKKGEKSGSFGAAKKSMAQMSSMYDNV